MATQTKPINPLVNGFRLRQDVYDVYAQQAKAERRKLTDMIRIALEDHAELLTQKKSKRTEKQTA